MMKKKNTGGWKAFNLHSLLKKERKRMREPGIFSSLRNKI